MATLWNGRSITVFDSAKHINVWIPPRLGGIEYELYEVSSEDEGRLDLISYKVYGSEDYFWIIAHANNILDPFNGFSAGNRLKVPNLRQYMERWKAYTR